MLQNLLEAALYLFASWTLSYHLLLLVRLPAKYTGGLSLVIFSLLVVFAWRRWKHVISLPQTNPIWFLWSIAVLSLGTGIFTLVVSRPDADDLVYFHRALVQLSHLDCPFFTTDTLHNVPDLPPFSYVHIMTSYEPLVAMVANWLRIDPLSAYHNISAFVLGVLLPIPYALLYRQFGVTHRSTILATLILLLFLLIDGNLHRSFGNFSLVRLWQGKVILIAFLLPLTLLFAYRYFREPTAHNFILLVLSGVSASGLSSSGIFLFPMFLFAISTACILSFGFSLIALKRAVLLNLGSIYCGGIAFALLTGLIPPISDSAVWDLGPAIWSQTLELVIGDRATLVRNLLILLILPLVGLKKPGAWFLFWLTIAIGVLFTNPIFGPFWFEHLRSGAYWRIAYLFPLPLSVGLIVPALIDNKDMGSYWLHISTVIVTGLAIFFASQYTVLFPPKGAAPVYFKMPWEYKLPPVELAFARSVSGRLQNKNLLAPQGVSVTLGLINPTIKFEATRFGTTLNILNNAGQYNEGLRREKAQLLVDACARDPEVYAAFLQSLSTGVNAVVTRDCQTTLLPKLADLQELGFGRWLEVERNNGYVLLLRHD